MAFHHESTLRLLFGTVDTNLFRRIVRSKRNDYMYLSWIACLKRLPQWSSRWLDLQEYVIPCILAMIDGKVSDSSVWRIGRQNYPYQILDPPLYEADPQLSSRPIDRCYVQEAATHFPRESFGIPREHDRYGQDCGYCASHDRCQLWL